MGVPVGALEAYSRDRTSGVRRSILSTGPVCCSKAQLVRSLVSDGAMGEGAFIGEEALIGEGAETTCGTRFFCAPP